MMIGEAQVIGMKPILRSAFSSARGVCASASAARSSGKIEARAAAAVPAPTARRNVRRVASCRNNAFTSAVSAMRVNSASPCGTASCSACVACRPQLQPRPAVESNGSEFRVMRRLSLAGRTGPRSLGHLGLSQC
jgi:hypothetical protein